MALRRNKSEGAQSRTSPKGSRVQGKITKQTVTPGMVEKRARELALIAGRDSEHITDSDRREAKRELLGAVHPTGRDRANRDTRQWNPAPASTGGRTPKILPHDTELTQELVEEGVDEAEHDLMVQARKSGK